MATSLGFIEYVNNLPPALLPHCGQCGNTVNVTVGTSQFRDELEISVYCTSCDTASVGGISGESIATVRYDQHQLMRLFMDKMSEVARQLEGGIRPPHMQLPLIEDPTPEPKESKKPFMRKDAPWNV